PVYSQITEGYGKLFEDIKAGRIVSAYAVERHGMAEAVSKMAFGNHMGVKIGHNVDPRDFFAPGWGDIVCEVPDGKVGELSISYTLIGEVTDRAAFEYGSVSIPLTEALDTWNAPLENVFPTESGVKQEEVKQEVFKADQIVICNHKIGTPNVFIPVFPGTNCEYDSTKVFERAGANVSAKVFRNLSAEDIRDSVELYRKEIEKAQIVMFPGGFSAGDEPEGSAKFFATAFRNEVVKEALMKLLNERDGLILGVCNGFQALIKLGLVPGGTITEQNAGAPTLTYNTIGRHISKMVNLKVVSNKSPWLAEAELGGVYVNPVSHGEGRFVASDEWLKKLFANGQVATQYVDADGNPTMDEYWNPNGSYMAIEGITSPDGRVYGKMAHSERRGDAVAKNIYGEQDMKIFESGVKYFK
ncbi:MAG: phosphoribosylformylglycinamidine synthase subunit PurQ, partial [Enterocloster sp.]